MNDPVWTCLPFQALEVYDLYAILRLRSEVFVVEQNCVFLDIDNKDLEAYHLLGWLDKNLVAYARILPVGVPYEYASIGRVVTASLVRRSGVGKQLFKKAIDYCHQLYGLQPIKIGGQLYLQKFYESFGFKKTSEIYLEDGIEHIEMLFKM